ncbi:cytochrome c [Candidatus Sumerlaeota bacterium]|nr:cytochrome c [Candidatus Sumerlaeota bacterium]
MKRLVALLTLTLLLLSAIPFAVAYRARSFSSQTTRFHIVPDMDNQARFKAQGFNAFFVDHRAMRPPVAGTAAREDALGDDFLRRGLKDGRWATEFPVPVTPEFVHRGQDRYNIFCAACHGYSGYGDGMIDKRAAKLAEGTWTTPASLHSDAVLGQPVGSLFNSISRGVRNMPSYSQQIPELDRWAIVAYVRALQKSQHASAAELPAEELTRLQPTDTKGSQP